MGSHLRIQLSGKDLVLPSDFSLDIEERNPLFNDVEMFSYPVELPLKGNRHIVQNVDDINADARVTELEHLPMNCWVDGVPFRSGLAVVQEDVELDDSVSINMDASAQSFSSLISNLKCNEIPVKDEIVIGEKIGNVHVEATYTFNVKADIKKHKDWHFSKSGNTVSGTFEPQALGFSYPGVCSVSNKQVALFDSERVYPRNHKVTIPKVRTSYINTSAAYGEALANGKPAYYANARVCYKHYELADDGTTSSETVEQKNSKNIYEDIYPYWVLDANRQQSGICFYVLYFLDCLFAYLGVEFDKSELMAIGDFKRLVFFTTKCAYTTRKASQYYSSSNGDAPYFSNLTDINKWLSSRGTGGQIEIEKPETKTVDSFTYTDKATKVTTHYKVGDDNCRSVTIKASYDKTPVVTADIYEMLASGENFPDESVQTVLDSFCAAFGVKFDYDYEQKKVRAYLLRNVFRQQDAEQPIKFHGKVYSLVPMSEKILGFRMRYSQEQDKKEQQQNISNAKKGINQNYETDYNYIDYTEDNTVYNKVYSQFFSKLSPTDENCYIDRTTGNAYRIKRNKDAKTMNEFKPVLFEVGGYKGVEIGDCSDVVNEDYIEDKTISFEPVIFNDVNYYRELDRLSGQTKIEDENGIIGDFNGSVSSVLAAYVDEQMEHEFVDQRIRNAIGDYYVDIYATEKLNLLESYNPDNTDNGNSPLQSYTWGTALAVMRGGGADMEVQNFDFGYDGFGTGKWRTVAGGYAMAADCIDNFGNDYDYNGKLDGIGNEERFSLKIRAYKNPDWAEEKGISLCNSDSIDPSTMAVVRKVKSRGLFDTFMSEYAHFLLHRKKFKVKAIVSAAQLVEINNRWKERWNIDGKIGYINKVNYKLSVSEGIQDVEIEFFCL